MSLTAHEDLLHFVDDRREDLLAFAGELISTPSPNPPGDERAVADLIKQRLGMFGLEAQLVAKSPERPNVLLTLPAKTSGLRLLLNGHIDTKPPGDLKKWNSDPYRPTIVDGKMYGLGACDMKGQAAALTYATIALASTAFLTRGELLLVLSADEECGSAYGAHYLVDEMGLKADAALVGELSGIHRDWEYLAILSRGFSGFRIKVYGTQVHSSISNMIPTVNASTKMAYVLWRLERDLKISFPPHPLCPEGITLNPGVFVSGGVYYGVYPGYAEFGVDVRTLPGMTKEGLRRDVESFLDQLRREDPQLQVEMEFEPGPLGWNEGAETSPDAPIVQAALRAGEQVLGFRPPMRGLPGGTDGNVFQGIGGIPSVFAFGPGFLPLAHNPNEYITVEAIVQAAKIYALTALNYCCGES